LEHSLNPWEKGIWWLSTVPTIAVLVRLWSSGLIKIYKLFFCYLAWDFLSSVVGHALTYNTNWYGYFYLFAQTLKVVIAAFMLAEIYSLAMERTPALARFGRTTVSYALAAAAFIPVVGLVVDRSDSGAYPYLHAFYLFEQTMDATMAIFLILMLLFMAWFPVQLRRNVIVYIFGFILWSVAHSTAAHAANLFPKNLVAIRVISSILMFISVGCSLFWLIGLRREGESQTAVVGHLWNRAEAKRLTDQLDAINNSLERLRRR
jgi:hypothetical protein